MDDLNVKDREGFLFSQSGLAANSVLSGLGAGATVAALSGAIVPALVVGAFGAGVGYILTNQIRKES